MEVDNVFSPHHKFATKKIEVKCKSGVSLILAIGCTLGERRLAIGCHARVSRAVPTTTHYGLHHAFVHCVPVR